MSEEGKTQDIHCQMSFDAKACICRNKNLSTQHPSLQVFFTACESTILNVVHCGFFWLVRAPCYVMLSESDRAPRLHTNFGNARRQWNMAVDPWVSQTNYNRSWVDKVCPKRICRFVHIGGRVFFFWGSNGSIISHSLSLTSLE